MHPILHEKETPRTCLLLAVFIALAWIPPGLFGHEPWKPDEGYTIGMVQGITETGDWVVPTLAGQPFMEKPPVFFITAALLGKVFSPWLMPLHQAMALAAALYSALTLLFMYLAGKEAGGWRCGLAAGLGLLGCVGFLIRAHSAITDNALWSGFAIACYGMILTKRRFAAGAFFFGAGAGMAFMAKGLAGPAFLGVALILLPVFCPEWRGAGWFRFTALAGAFSLPWLLIWPTALYLRSPELFRDWFWYNNIGRFAGPAFGFPALAQTGSPYKYLGYFPWFCLPLWPPALLALWRRGRAAWRDPALVYPVLVVLAGMLILSAASGKRDLYMIPLLVPLAVLAAQAGREIPSWLAWLLTRPFLALSGIALAVIWLVWLAWRFRFSGAMDGYFEEFAPGMIRQTAALAVVAALAYTILWVAAFVRTRSFRNHWDWVWAAGITAVWGSAMFLFVPILDYTRSYHPTFAGMVAHVPGPSAAPVESVRLGESQTAILEYYFGVRTRNVRSADEARGEYLLVQIEPQDGEDERPGKDWESIWEGTRPGARKEYYALYRRVFK